MLTLVETRKEKVEAQGRLKATLQKAWSGHETRIVVWRPASRKMTIHHNGTYWFGSFPPDENEKTPKYWDPFGEYHKNGNLQIAVEINVPTESNGRRVSGFFAKDTTTGSIYLTHDGGVGGGREGVGRDSFLAWSHARPIPVLDSEGNERLGIIVAPIQSPTTADDIARFVRKAIDFKEAAKRGETASRQAHSEQRTYKNFYGEFRGKKRRRRIEEVEYISRHGDIVDALNAWRRRPKGPGERVVKNAYIDLGIETEGVLTELYEVKTNCDRQTLYTAIGQVLVHDDAQGGVCQRFVVLPTGDTIPDDISRALTCAHISVLRFAFAGTRIRILG